MSDVGLDDRGVATGPVSLVVVSAGVSAGDPCPTRLLADRIAESVCWSLTTAGERVEVEVLELRRLTTDLAPHRPPSLDLREAIAAVATADGIVLATPVVLASPSAVLAAFFDVLEDGVLSGTPVLLAVTSRARRRPPDIEWVMRGRLTCLHAVPVPTVVVAGPRDWADDDPWLGDRIDQAAAELAATVGPRRRSTYPSKESEEVS